MSPQRLKNIARTLKKGKIYVVVNIFKVAACHFVVVQNFKFCRQASIKMRGEKVRWNWKAEKMLAAPIAFSLLIQTQAGNNPIDNPSLLKYSQHAGGALAWRYSMGKSNGLATAT
ncbi:hypothetical protein B0H13DRAFT_1888497 [Mycena leptocephala]|nr:hypothetical protein B0H13DRAFT_1888497 [Mycena leptocephala]